MLTQTESFSRRDTDRRTRTAPGRRLALWPAAAVAASVAAIVAADLVNPAYSPVTEVISRYVNGNHGWLITAALLTIGVASAASAARLRSADVSRTGRVALLVWAAGVFVAGIFPADPPGLWGQPSPADMVHGMAATLAFVALPLAALLLHRGLAARWARGAALLRVVSRFSLVSTAVLVVFLGDVMGGPSLSIGGFPTVVGLVERIAFGADLLWVALAAVAVSRPATRRTR
ncbi:DUF998 domain-containing protein [Streptomyces sp. NBC_00483]|uniref:DUF998 domain-containing protein n=1 Tax=Streptomyces sp. NBC_00483 TaxID=2975756 RepID=UPI002E17D3D0